LSQLNSKKRNRSHAPHWKSLTIPIFLIAISFASLSIPKVYAPTGSEIYRFYASSPRIQETNPPPATLYLNISNAGIGSPYHVSFAVTDPSGNVKTASNATTATTASFILSVVYPRDFPAGTAIRFVGNYTVNVSQSQPSNKPSVATGSFLVGLTDSKTYSRTSLVWVKASAYTPLENITTILTQGGNPVPGFPSWKLADTNGNLNFSWRIPPTGSIGTYSLTLTGSSTTKTVPDTQMFTVTVTTVLIPGMTAKYPNIARSLTQQLLFAPQYPDGQRVQTGQAIIRITQTDGTNAANATANYDPLTGTFRCPYDLPETAMAGVWIATIDPNNLDDGYGNTGPSLTVTTGFNVQAAALNVTIISFAIGVRTYTVGDIIPIYASVTFPDGASMDTGTVQARITRNGIPIGLPVTLTYITGQQAWAGTYQVTSNDPSGLWLITVDGSDQLGDSGQGTYSATVNVPPPNAPTWLTTSNFLLIVAIIAGAFLAFLVWALFSARRRVTHKQMKIDLSVVDKEVSKIQDSPFFQNVKKQMDEKPKDSPPKTDAKTDDS
jgi:hypothetical protein